jgi:hypothetical protein
LLRTGRNLHNNYVSTVFYVMEKNIPVSSSQFLLGSIFVAFSPKGLFIKVVKLFFQPNSPGHCTFFAWTRSIIVPTYTQKIPSRGDYTYGLQ